MEIQQLQFHLDKGNINWEFYETYLQDLRRYGEITPDEYAAGINYESKRGFVQKKAEALELIGIKPA